MTIPVTLELPDTLFQQAQRIARTRKQDIHDVLLRSISLDDIATVDNLQVTDVDREEAAFQRMHGELVKTHFGQYVAIRDEKLIGSDSDQIALLRRVRKQFPEGFILVAPVRDSSVEEYVFRSPRFV